MEKSYNPLYLCGILLTYAENFAFYIYTVYLPCVIILKILNMVIWIVCIGSILGLIMILFAEELQIDVDTIMIKSKAEDIYREVIDTKET